MKNKGFQGILILTSIVSVILTFTGCKGKASLSSDKLESSGEIDTLKVVTLYGPTSFFDYRGELMGVDYENVKRFANDEGIEIEISTVNNIQELIQALQKGDAHLAAYPIPYIAEYNDEIIHCGNKDVSWQVLVQKKDGNEVKDVTELVGKDIYVENNSKYHFRLNNLNEEIGGGINVIAVNNDTISSEDFLPMVSSGEIEFAVVDSDIAALYRSAYPDLDTSVKLSSEQVGSWAVALGLDTLAKKIDNWEKDTHSSQLVKEIYKTYYDRSLSEPFDINLTYFKKRDISKGKPVSDYDNIFKKYASTAGYDWELLASIAYCESRYNTNISSRFGAYGLMQVMPVSARGAGISPDALGNPDTNVLAASRIIQKLDKSLEDKVTDPQERMKFVIASYNSGLGHIYDAMALADKIGLDPQKWTGNVSVTALMKSRPEYYNDPVVKHGYFRGRETVEFVDQVTSIYRYLKENIPS